MTDEDGPRLVELPPGAYVLENSALDEPTPKRVHVRRQLAEIVERRGLDVVEGLAQPLRDPGFPTALPSPIRQCLPRPRNLRRRRYQRQTQCRRETPPPTCEGRRRSPTTRLAPCPKAH